RSPVYCYHSRVWSWNYCEQSHPCTRKGVTVGRLFYVHHWPLYISSRREIILRDLVLREWPAEDRLKSALGAQPFARRADDQIRNYLGSLSKDDFRQWRYFGFAGEKAIEELPDLLGAQASHLRRIP